MAKAEMTIVSAQVPTQTSGVPAFSPHDLRHRRISLLLREEDPVTVSRLVGHANASMSLDVYGHVLLDEAEIDYADALT